MIKYITILVISMLLLGCAEYDVGDKVCLHQYGICEGEVMEVKGNHAKGYEYIIFFDRRGVYHYRSNALSDGRMYYQAHEDDLKEHDDDYFPVSPLHER